MDIDELCSRIDTVDADLHAFVAEPGRRDRLLREMGEHPLPIGVKDVIHVAGLPTAAGSNLPPDVLTGDEAPVVTRLKEHGALVVGKTVTAEFAFQAPGETRNPHNRNHTPGGSSSGSAAAVAAGLVPAALGTQTVGSVIRPAAFCGIVGFKPTYGRISTEGVIANAPSFDTVGVLAASVGWVERVAAIACAGWTPAAAEGRPVLAVPIGAYLDQTEPEARVAFFEQVNALRDKGFEVREVPALDDIEVVAARNRTINLYELARVHERWFDSFASLYEARTATGVREGRKIATDEYEAALRDRERYAEELVAGMDAFDVWVAPSAPGPAPDSLATTGNATMNLPWTQARLPVVGLPAGKLDGLPLGLQFVARPHHDEQLVAWAAELSRSL
ncbi:amidase [Tenggerimyces flavus]|uniref:Amidase n=1 Tax=Tenggerimyces flavus TaxID=1708749 RepID=A0ABV7YS69_9ACTN|nr:amidase [Tenggerimyces flavus]MBM7784434.1 Asp-tRNA(Asn)/Glu-tRNA(Gln) amidotransferase A subunit family amidase [Tenggerimyces flavus]